MRRGTVPLYVGMVEKWCEERMMCVLQAQKGTEERRCQALKERAIRFICSLTEGIIDYKSLQRYTRRQGEKEKMSQWEKWEQVEGEKTGGRQGGIGRKREQGRGNKQGKSEKWKERGERRNATENAKEKKGISEERGKVGGLGRRSKWG